VNWFFEIFVTINILIKRRVNWFFEIFVTINIFFWEYFFKHRVWWRIIYKVNTVWSPKSHPYQLQYVTFGSFRMVQLQYVSFLVHLGWYRGNYVKFVVHLMNSTSNLKYWIWSWKLKCILRMFCVLGSIVNFSYII